MKKLLQEKSMKCIFLIMFFLTGAGAWGQVWTNPITGTNPNSSNPYTTGDVKATNVTVSGIGRGPGISGTDANNRYNASGWATSTALDTNDYFQFTITPGAGYKIDFTNFVYTSQASGTGPRSFAFRSSADNYATNIGTPTATGTTISLSAAAYQNRTTAITFRLYAFNASGGTGTFSINDFTFNGTVTATGNPPTVASTVAANAITTTGAASGGNISSNGGATLTERGVVYSSTATTPTTSHSKSVATGTGTGDFTTNLTGLTPNTRYYYRAYATNAAGTSYGPTVLSFYTASLPTVTTTAQSNVTTTSATAGGNVTALGTTGGTSVTASTVTAKGIVWALSTSADPTITTNLGITNDGTGTGSYPSTLTGLSMNTSYKYRAYATSPEGTSYGSIVTFSTLNIVAPTVVTNTFNNQDDAGVNSANIKGSVTNNGNAAIVRKGFVWNSTGENLTVDNATATTVDDTDDTDAAFTTAISGLLPNSRYYYIAFANNGTATGYGAINNFYSKAATPGMPVVNNPTTTTLTVTNDANSNPTATEYVIRILTPVGIRYINSLGGVTDTEVWLTGTTLASPLVVTGLSAGTSYTFDVKARNTAGIETPYSSTTTESTASPSTPYLTLIDSSLAFGPLCINTTSSAGYFTFQANNVPVGQQIAIYSLEGFTYSLTENGTYQNGLFFNNTGSAITVYVKFTPTEVQPYPEEVGGVPGTIGVNSNNTSTLNIPVFGEGVNTPAIAVTGTSSNVTVTGATLAGQLTQGCSAITGYGIEYSTTPAFGDGTGTAVAGSNLASGNFTVDVTGLSGCTTYYYKAYVTDATGTYYGSQSTFTTPAVSAPTGIDATSITQTGFTANWDAVPGATGYYLDVSTNPNFETVFLNEDFSGVTIQSGDPNIASSLNTYTNTPGWTGNNVYAENGNVRVGAGSTTLYNITTPTVNLSLGGGVGIISFSAKHHTDQINKTLKVMFSANGSSTYTTLETITLTDQYQTFSVPFTGGGANSKFRFETGATTSNRFQIDDIKVSNSQLIAGYNNLAVTTGTSQAVTGLNPDTQYYYRVRAYGTNCTTDNSNTIEVTTLKYLTLGETDNLAFGDVCTNTTETGSFTFTGSGMTGATLTVAALTGYTYSLTEEGIYTSTLSIPDFNGGEVTVFVKFSPTAVQAYNGNITVQGSVPYAAAMLTVPVTGAGIFTAAVATAEAAANITMTSASINATSTAGNCTTNTGYGIEYSTTNNFTPGDGIQIAGAGITGGAYTVTLENLLPCKTYYYRAYTTTSGATVYSAQLSFTTTAIGAPVSIDATEINATSFTANWETVENAAGYKLDVSTNPEFGIGNFGNDLIISEYIEGTSNNKALEIYNGTGAAVNLSGYSLRQQQNGSGNFGATSSYVFNFPAVSLPAGSVYILRSDQASGLSINASHPSSLTTSLNYSASGGPTVHFTGNDAIGLFNGSTMIDVIGVVNGGSSNIWGAEKTFRRKSSVLSPSATYDTNQWDEFAQNNSGLGAHNFDGGFIPSYVDGYENFDVAGDASTSAGVSGLDPFTTYYYRVSAYTADCTTAESETVEVITRGTVTWKDVNGTAKWVPEFYADGTTPIVINESIDTAIEANYNTATNGVFAPKSVTINSGIFTVAAGTNFTVENNIVNNAAAENFVVESNGNLIQNNAQNSNSGAITVKRDSSPLFRNDYVMWSSPVAGQDMVAFSPATTPGRYYQYSPEPGENEGQENGMYIGANGNFEPGKGYLIRMPNGGYNFDTQAPTGTINGTVAQYNNGNATMVFNGKFTGVPNNGDISVTLSNTGGSYHLIGNPYPSPLSLPAFLAENEDVITGTVYVWRKKNASTATSAYVTMNRSGQYVDNGEPNTDPDPLGVIRTGQGFIVQMVENPTNNEVVFNNSMRSENTSNQFFRNANNNVQRPESHGVYFNLTNAAGVYSQMYTGYVDGATDGPDNGIDAEYINDKPNVLSTVMAEKEYVIHGRALPFNTENTEPLQLRVASAGEYTITIDRTEGLFNTQDIYLKDNLLNVVHNIKASPYTFTTTAGTFMGRFEVVYSPDGALGTENPIADENSIIIFKQDNTLKINSVKQEISEVTVFDIRGRKVYEATNVNAISTETNGLQAEQQALIVKVKTANGVVISKKVIF